MSSKFNEEHQNDIWLILMAFPPHDGSSRSSSSTLDEILPERRGIPFAAICTDLFVSSCPAIAAEGPSLIRAARADPPLPPNTAFTRLGRNRTVRRRTPVASSTAL